MIFDIYRHSLKWLIRRNHKINIVEKKERNKNKILQYELHEYNHKLSFRKRDLDILIGIQLKISSKGS